MASVHDVAAYILREKGEMSTWKLQKLVYYSQAWHMVWEEEPLFDERIEAWAHGPVVRDLYDRHRQWYRVSAWRWGDPDSLTARERTAVDAVLSFYGDKDGHWLSELTHIERPWLAAREGLAPGERGNRVITPVALKEYYASL